MRMWIILAAISLAPTGLTAATPCDSCVTCDAGACQSCNSCPSNCVVCRCHQNLRPVRVEQWCVTTEPLCISWCQLFSCFRKSSDCSSSSCDSSGCDSCAVDAPASRRTRVRPKNRLIRKTEYRFIPIVEFLPEELENHDNCRGNCHCDASQNVAGVNLQSDPIIQLPVPQVSDNLPSKTEVEQSGPTIHWLDTPAPQEPIPLGMWTTDGSHQGRDVTSPPTVHWISGPPSRIDTNETQDEKPIYRVTDTVEPTLAPVIDGPR